MFHFQMRSFWVLTTLLDHLKFNKKLRGEGLLHSQEAISVRRCSAAQECADAHTPHTGLAVGLARLACRAGLAWASLG